MLKESGTFDETNIIHMLVYCILLLCEETSNFYHRDCLRFCFMDLLQEELDETQKMWNTHLIRHARSPDQVNGITNELFYIPHVGGEATFSCTAVLPHNVLF